MTPSPGATIGPYRLDAPIGRGGLAEVWRGTDTRTGATVAVKLFTAPMEKAGSERIRAEAELLAAHAIGPHPNVVRVLDGGMDPLPHVVMELVPGTDLAAELARRGALSPLETCRIGRAVASALAAATAAGIVHRDVKPSNVLLGTDGSIRLTDFNIARIAGYQGASVSGQLLLSFAYSAPEVWDGGGDARSDLYALGALLYECLTGAPPFGGTYTEVFRGHLEKPPDLAALPDGTPSDLASLIGELLAKDPADRPADAASVAARLAAIGDALAPGRLPERIGPYAVAGPHPSLPSALRATDPATGRAVTLEIIAGDLATGALLSRAVAANSDLVPLGAERLLAANRLLLRPGEAVPGIAPGSVVFWVAREELPLPPPPRPLGAPALARLAAALVALRDAATARDLLLDLSPRQLVVLPDGSPHVLRPGLPSSDPDPAGLAALAGVAEPDIAWLVRAAPSLEALMGHLGRIGAEPVAAIPDAVPASAAREPVSGSVQPTPSVAATVPVTPSPPPPSAPAPPSGEPLDDTASVVSPTPTLPLISPTVPLPPPPPPPAAASAPGPEPYRNRTGILAAGITLLLVLVLGGGLLLSGALGTVASPSPTPGDTPTPVPTPGDTPTPVVTLASPAGTFVSTHPMVAARMSHSATLLGDGRVLITGSDDGHSTVAELFDPSTGDFTVTGDTIAARGDHTSTLLQDGRVLLSGGWGGGGPPVASAELYDPTNGAFTATGHMNSAREAHTATRLRDGRVLVTGGMNGHRIVASAELYDPVTGTFNVTGTMLTPRDGHTATLLRDGRVLVVGGVGRDHTAVASSELYDPKTGAFSKTGPMGVARYGHTATLLGNGRVLVTGGGDDLTFHSSSELYDPRTGKFSPTGRMEAVRFGHGAALLDNGRVLVTGGAGDPDGSAISTAELYDPRTGEFTKTGRMSTGRYGHSSTQLADGSVLAAGGVDREGDTLSSAELYIP